MLPVLRAALLGAVIGLISTSVMPVTLAAATAGAPPGIKLATWNLEWLMTPQTFRSLQGHCTSNDAERRTTGRQLPCDVAATLERGAADFSAMRRYAEKLDADVVAVEEVDGPDAARQLFAHYDFCFTGAVALQNTGFAIRPGIPFRCEPDVVALSLGDSLRRGAVVVLYPGTSQELYLLAVHLKSGCAIQRLDSRLDACAKLAQQLPVLADWIESQARAGHRFALLGDFNRDLLAEASAPHGATLLGALGGARPVIPLYSAATRGDFRNCARGQRHNGFIDYILLGDALFKRRVSHSVERLIWNVDDAARRKLSDHCPVAIRIEP